MTLLQFCVSDGMKHKKFYKLKAKKKNTLVSGNADDKKNHHPGGCKFFFFFLINLIACFHFSLLKNKESYLLLFKEKKTLIRPNKSPSGKPP